VLKRIEYCPSFVVGWQCPADTPGIDAPVQKDAELTYRKIESSDTSAVVCVPKPASAGDMTKEETELLEKMRSNPGICDRVSTSSTASTKPGTTTSSDKDWMI